MIKITADDFLAKALNADNLIHNKAVKNASILEVWKVDETIYFQVGDAFSSTENIDNLTSVSENTIPSDALYEPGSPGAIFYKWKAYNYMKDIGGFKFTQEYVHHVFPDGKLQKNILIQSVEISTTGEIGEDIDTSGPVLVSYSKSQKNY